MNKGEARRLDRIARGRSLREEAAELRISPQALSDIEHGRDEDFPGWLSIRDRLKRDAESPEARAAVAPKTRWT